MTPAPATAHQAPMVAAVTPAPIHIGRVTTEKLEKVISMPFSSNDLFCSGLFAIYVYFTTSCIILSYSLLCFKMLLESAYDFRS